VPVVRAVSTPLPLSEATAGDVWLQVPPGEASVSAVDKPTHTVSDPLIAAGNGFIVTGRVIKQPVPKV